MKPARSSRHPALAFCMTVASFGLCLAACGGGDATVRDSEAPASLASGLSADEVVERMRQAMRRPGYIYHQRMSREQDADIYSNTGTFDYWLSADGQRARKHFDMRLLARPEGERMLGQEIVVGDQVRDLELDSGVFGDPAPAPLCAGLSAAESQVLNCRADQIIRWEVADGQYDGRPAIVLTGRSFAEEDPEAALQAEAYYLDAETFLPFALRAEGVILFGSPTFYEVRATMENDFIPEGALPAGLFDPDAQVEPTPVE